MLHAASFGSVRSLRELTLASFCSIRYSAASLRSAFAFGDQGFALDPLLRRAFIFYDFASRNALASLAYDAFGMARFARPPVRLASLVFPAPSGGGNLRFLDFPFYFFRWFVVLVRFANSSSSFVHAMIQSAAFARLRWLRHLRLTHLPPSWFAAFASGASPPTLICSPRYARMPPAGPQAGQAYFLWSPLASLAPIWFVDLIVRFANSSISSYYSAAFSRLGFIRQSSLAAPALSPHFAYASFIRLISASALILSASPQNSSLRLALSRLRLLRLRSVTSWASPTPFPPFALRGASGGWGETYGFPPHPPSLVALHLSRLRRSLTPLRGVETSEAS